MVHSRCRGATRGRLAGLGVASLVFACLAAVPAVTMAAGPHSCSGTLKKPGVLAGTYPTGVVISGACEVNAGPVRVEGTLTLKPDSVLVAAFGRNHRTHKGGSSLTVTGNVDVGKGATLVLGCNPKSSPCVDDNQHQPKLTSRGAISGNVKATSPLGILIHTSRIGGSVTENGGGGGVNCTPAGVFKQLIKSPVFSTVEDSTVYGSISVSNLKTCWLGFARVHVIGDLKVTGNKVADPDAIEILSNAVHKNLACQGNSQVWDSAEANSMSMALYPRVPQPNTVDGKRSGQCVLASPATMGGPSGPGPF